MEHKSLRDYIQLVESAQQVQELDASQAGNLAGQAASTVVNAATAPARAVWDGAKWLYNKGTDAVNSAVQGVQNFASGAAQGFQTGGLDPLHPEKSAQQAQQSYAQAGKPQQGATPSKPATKPVAGKSEPWVKELQTKLNAAGEKLAVDGVMGPATRQAQSRHPEITTQPAAAQAHAASLADVPQQQQQAATPAAPAAPAAPATAPNPWEGKDPAKAAAWAQLTPNQQKWLGGADPTDQYILARAPKNESMGYDEVDRIVSLVHYR